MIGGISRQHRVEKSGLVDLDETRAGNGGVGNIIWGRETAVGVGESSDGQAVQVLRLAWEEGSEVDGAVAGLEADVLDWLRDGHVLLVDVGDEGALVLLSVAAGPAALAAVLAALVLAAPLA